MAKASMYQLKKNFQIADVDLDDLISLERAAKLSGRPVATIANMLDRGRLPWFQWQDEAQPGERIQRFTLRSAVIELYSLE